MPTVLVNGSEGIGTCWSSYIPNYNPRDIIANIRHLLSGDAMDPMDPWYKWFKGTVEKTAAKEEGNSYTICGTIEEVNETTLRITELPIRRWTQDYKEFLESFSSSNKECKDPFIEVNLLKSLRIMLSTTMWIRFYLVSHDKIMLAASICDVNFSLFLCPTAMETEVPKVPAK